MFEFSGGSLSESNPNNWCTIFFVFCYFVAEFNGSNYAFSLVYAVLYYFMFVLYRTFNRCLSDFVVVIACKQPIDRLIDSLNNVSDRIIFFFFYFLIGNRHIEYIYEISRMAFKMKQYNYNLKF